METLHIPLDDSERDALQELARARGLDPTTQARRLLGERIRVSCSSICDPAPDRLPNISPPEDRIELRLIRLFGG